MRPAKLKVGLVQQAVADNDKATNWNKSAEQIAKLAQNDTNTQKSYKISKNLCLSNPNLIPNMY